MYTFVKTFAHRLVEASKPTNLICSLVELVPSCIRDWGYAGWNSAICTAIRYTIYFLCLNIGTKAGMTTYLGSRVPEQAFHTPRLSSPRRHK